MITKLGLKLREIRRHNGDKLMDMAKKLGVTSPFLSAIEHGNKQPPISFVDSLGRVYDLSNSMRTLITKECDQMRSTVTIKATSAAARETASVFARRIGAIPEDRLKEIVRLLKDEDENE